MEDLGSNSANSVKSSFFKASYSARVSSSKFYIGVDCSLGSLRSFRRVDGGVVGIILGCLPSIIGISCHRIGFQSFFFSYCW